MNIHIVFALKSESLVHSATLEILPRFLSLFAEFLNKDFIKENKITLSPHIWWYARTRDKILHRRIPGQLAGTHDHKIPRSGPRISVFLNFCKAKIAVRVPACN